MKLKLFHLVKENHLLLSLVIVCLILSAHFYDIFTPEFFSIRAAEIELYIQSKRVLAMVAFCLIYIGFVAFSVPAASVLTLASGYFFGFLTGGGLSFISAFIGATIFYCLVRTGLRDRIKEKLILYPAFKDIELGLQSNAMNYLLFIRLFPFVPFWIANIAPPVLGVSLKVFSVTTFLGILPGTAAIAYLGSKLKTFKLIGEDSTFSPTLDFTTLLALSVISILGLFPIWRKFFKK